VFAGVVSDYLGGRALTCLMMLLFAAPSVSHDIIVVIGLKLLLTFITVVKLLWLELITILCYLYCINTSRSVICETKYKAHNMSVDDFNQYLLSYSLIVLTTIM